MSKRRRQINRQPTPQLKKERIQRKSRSALKNAGIRLKGMRGGLPDLSGPFLEDFDVEGNTSRQFRRLSTK